jgi:hypothetical protein
VVDPLLDVSAEIVFEDLRFHHAIAALTSRLGGCFLVIIDMRITTFSACSRTIVSAVAAALVLTGCATTDSSKQSSGEAKAKPGPAVEASMPLPSGVTLRKAKDLQGVWVEPGFNFGGKPRLMIEPTVYKGEVRENEGAMREFAVRELREQIAKAAGESGLFSYAGLTDATPAGATTNGVTYRLVNTIVEYEKGGGGARYFAGLYGAGQPVIRVHGELLDTNNHAVFIYEAKRSGEGAGARLVGAFKSDEEIQREDIRDLAIDLADFMVRTAGLTPPKR